MKKIYTVLFITLSLLACKNEPKKEEVSEVEETEEVTYSPKDEGKGAEIINTVIDSAGGHLYETATIEFTFRNATYKSIRNCGMFEFSREKTDDAGNQIVETVSNLGFTYLKNEKEEVLADSTAAKYTSSINSVLYFAQLPFGLNDSAVRKELIAEDSIHGKPYYKIQVNFAENGGGEDFQDIYVYWVNKNNYHVDYLAYSYEVNGGGMRFREAVNPREVKGIRFVDYKNYAPKKGASPKLEDLDALFEKEELELFSTIENKDVKVEVLERNCA